MKLLWDVWWMELILQVSGLFKNILLNRRYGWRLEGLSGRSMFSIISAFPFTSDQYVMPILYCTLK